MKKKLYLLFLLSILNYAKAQQTYTFDYLLKTTHVSERGTFTVHIMMNSENPNYHMYIANNPAVLHDDKNNSRREIVYTNLYDETTYYFISHVKNKKTKDELKIDHITVEKMGENTYSVKSFPGKKDRRANMDFTVHVKPADKDLIYFYYLDRPNSINLKLSAALKEKLNGNYIISDYTQNGKYKFQHYVNQVDKINFTLTARD